MLKVDVSGLTQRLAQGIQRQEARVAGQEPSEQEVHESLRVSLSELSRTRASAKNEDVDEAELPDNIKEIVKLIRALRQQIAEKQAELQALAADGDMDPELRQVKAEALRSELATLQSALTSAQFELADALKDKRLTDDQRMQALKLAMS
ncbi:MULTISPECIES: hypothetical protein [unclassified Pseudomonas]|uniref:hypothetical protein n=1 Tax=unclassified Pseudomonas TaxID=196821 RepID=UPI00244D272E|nr:MULTISPECIES: hypothetical protein [unclassified Pseudomonas]MDG9927077.1 hypothetical protein [Pseudomonas sp. GD04042]MDH0482914.1 hypothetical protein [Pseudomonas sp. GD04015]MDH0602492.1 hypothetical protein [Pseudomonas sp. GD03869]MDH0893235.1 hypothetical protein [Pseudomonas sp. GD03875]MDH1062944.1 hypothetical protein [Pseudomonas sp. GD03985]